MRRNNNIPVHSMDDWDCGIYIKPFSATNAVRLSYDLAQAHRHDFYYCVLLDEGAMELEVDLEKIQLEDYSVFLSYPGQVHQIKNAWLKRGWFLAFDPSRLDTRLAEVMDQCLAEVIHFRQSVENSMDFFLSAQQLYNVYSEKEQLFREPVIQSMVTALVYRLVSAYLTIEKLNHSPHSTRSIEIARQFRQILRREYKTLKRPCEFADRMNISTSHLNDTVRAVTGFSVTHCIQQEIVREAKRLICYSGLSIKEIANDLGFEDGLYFNRLFRKITGVTAARFNSVIQSKT